MSLTNPTQQLIPTTQCLFGTVLITPTGLIGATTGFLIASGIPIPIRQVPGPGISGTPISQLNGQLAVVCGNVVQDVSGVVLNVTFAFPISAI